MGKQHVYTFLNQKGEECYGHGFLIEMSRLKDALRELRTNHQTVAVLRNGEVIAKRVGDFFNPKNPDNPLVIMRKGRVYRFGPPGSPTFLWD